MLRDCRGICSAAERFSLELLDEIRVLPVIPKQ
jgi:hypothetical protein